MTPSDIPFTAWEQAAIVVLVLLFVLTLIGVLLSSQHQMQGFLMKWSVSWQDYLTNLRKQDCENQNRREQAFSERNGKVVEALNEVTTHLTTISREFAEHDARMVQALEDMRAARNENKPPPQKTTRKPRST